MFEEKARLAQSAGAEAVIVIQNDPKAILFHMAGVSAQDESPSTYMSSTIATYMISLANGNRLWEKLSEPADGARPLYQTQIVTAPQLDTMRRLPRVTRISSTKVIIQGGENWSTDLTKEEDTWSLYLFEHRPVKDAPIG
mmetsp:Transcript_23966/g.42245  ORF Transcript_23966/g.42245 Transcript_23966/m.42245 type:complete len:140 (+) Transcript_23966:1-420(+)